MACDRIKMADGSVLFICSRSKRRVMCGLCRKLEAEFLCDYKIGPKRTCDRPLCSKCAIEVGPNTHQCFVHKGQQEELPLFTSKERALLFGK